ncbi:hypothetical protein I3843_08G127100 [Carya illinoinensis]|nr:hypothetical protein I3843_08G127100 [Carya illinoinensis]
MKRSRNTKRVSWSPGVKLCQVKLFSLEDCPAEVGLRSEDHLQSRTSWMLHSETMESNHFPPGFGGSPSEKHLKKEPIQARRLKWKCPPKFVMSHNWQVVAGEESKEVEAQKIRETRVLEAVYPRPSAIPPSPSVSRDIESEHCDDSLTPIVPTNPIEEEESAVIPSNLTLPMNNTLVCPQPLPSETMNPPTPKCSTSGAPTIENALEILPKVGADVIATASTALASLMKTNQQGSLIDTDLLIKILSDPKMIQKLIADHPPPVNPVSPPPANTLSEPANTGTAPMNVSKPVTPTVYSAVSKPDIQRPGNGFLYQVPNGVRPTLNNTLPPHPDNGMKPVVPSLALSCPEPNKVLPPKPANGNLYGAPLNQVRPALNAMPAQPIKASISSFSAMEAKPVKDANYYKNLIRQHGGEKQEPREQPMLGQKGELQSLVQNIKHGEMKPKSKKRCIYFNGPKGCRNGVNCPFQHDMSYQWRTGSSIIEEFPSAKRMRLGGEITGGI